MDIQAIGLGVSVAGGVAAVALYVIRSETRSHVERLDGRINTHEAECSQRQAKLDERHEHINGRLDSIDHKMDRVLERL